MRSAMSERPGSRCSGLRNDRDAGMTKKGRPDRSRPFSLSPLGRSASGAALAGLAGIDATVLHRPRADGIILHFGRGRRHIASNRHRVVRRADGGGRVAWCACGGGNHAGIRRNRAGRLPGIGICRRAGHGGRPWRSRRAHARIGRLRGHRAGIATGRWSGRIGGRLGRRRILRDCRAGDSGNAQEGGACHEECAHRDRPFQWSAPFARSGKGENKKDGRLVPYAGDRMCPTCDG